MLSLLVQALASFSLCGSAKTSSLPLAKACKNDIHIVEKQVVDVISLRLNLAFRKGFIV
jgi:hypothetical protein